MNLYQACVSASLELKVEPVVTFGHDTGDLTMLHYTQFEWTMFGVKSFVIIDMNGRAPFGLKVLPNGQDNDLNVHTTASFLAEDGAHLFTAIRHVYDMARDGHYDLVTCPSCGSLMSVVQVDYRKAMYSLQCSKIDCSLSGPWGTTKRQAVDSWYKIIKKLKV